MFEASCLVYLYVETPLHAGSGRGLAVVDLPVQRERVTGYPLVQASGIKGKLRDHAYRWKPFLEKQAAIKAKLIQEGEPENAATERRARRQTAQETGLETVFGPETDNAADHAGALSPGDARLLLFPVRSLAGVFVWTTSRDALARFFRDAATAHQVLEIERNGERVGLTLPDSPDSDRAFVASSADITAGGKLVLEEFSFTPIESDLVKNIAEWLADHALPNGSEHAYWQAKLRTSLVVLPENAFRDFALYATEVVTRVRLDDEKKTVVRGALWTEENLPTDTLLYLPLHATRARSYDRQGNRTTGIPAGWYEGGGAGEILRFVQGLGLTRIQLGGDETVGRGMVYLRFGEVHNAEPTTDSGTEAGGTGLE